ncbi:Mevalonate kinase [Mycoemilia scoparia]|uniref:Mevalonate kinase n=1 Tax=Mycoemilia scoparia TaxID=417184 RepID=A0A9W8DUK2_9FUNG|nr:Mevalonate kinase [Mycoemilia scoparia]
MTYSTAPDSKAFVISAPAKTILFGEHAVVYGKAAVATSMDLRTYTLIVPTLNDTTISIDFTDLGEKVSLNSTALPSLSAKDLEHPLKIEEHVFNKVKLPEGHARAALLAFIYLYSCIVPQSLRSHGFKITFKSFIPVGAGLGSSASFSVCAATALLQYAGLIALGQGPIPSDHLALINKWAFGAEQVIHGNPSGIDNTVCTYGGFIRFQKERPLQKIQTKFPLNVILTNTLVPKNTKALVAGVRTLWEKHRSVIDPIFESIHHIAVAGSEMFISAPDPTLVTDPVSFKTSQRAFEEDVEDLVKLNHDLLATLRVSHPSLETVVNTTKEFSFSTKLTGAGGGGCALTLVPHSAENFKIDACKAALKEYGFDCYRTTAGGGGVQAIEAPHDKLAAWMSSDHQNSSSSFVLLSQDEMKNILSAGLGANGLESSEKYQMPIGASHL